MPNNKHVFVRYPLLFGEGAYLIGDLHMFYKNISTDTWFVDILSQF